MSALTGRVVGQFDRLPQPGVAVKYGGLTAVKTNADGRFDVPGTADATVRPLVFSRTGFVARTTRAAFGERDWGIIPSTFNMPAYDDVARQEDGTSTIRWVSHPTVYVDTRPEGFTHPDLSLWIGEVRVQAQDFIQKWTGAVLRAAAVIVTDSPPPDLSAGTIVIHFSENLDDYWGQPYIGAARRAIQSDRTIVGGAVHMRYKGYAGNPGKRKGILAHELGHVLGMAHMSGTLEPSLMAPSLGSKSDLKPFDHLIAAVSYDREPGTATPDTYGGSTGGRPRRGKKRGGVTEEEEEPREVKVHKWVCGHPDKEKD